MVSNSCRAGNRIADKNRFCLSSGQRLIHGEIMRDARIFIIEIYGHIRSRRYCNSRFIERDILRYQVDRHRLTAAGGCRSRRGRGSRSWSSRRGRRWRNGRS
jgi:hypothetical protein